MDTAQALEAILARINGIWDNEQLMKVGPLDVDEVQDILHIATEALVNNGFKLPR